MCFSMECKYQHQSGECRLGSCRFPIDAECNYEEQKVKQYLMGEPIKPRMTQPLRDQKEIK